MAQQPEKVFDLNEAINKGLISKFSDPGAAAAGGAGGAYSRIDYFKAKGAGEGVFKPESFYTQTDTAYTNALLNLYSAKAKRGWAQRGTKAILEEQKQRTQQIKDVGRRELGEKQASAKRIARVTGGLLAGAQAPALDNLSTGPMLGAESGLGTESTLGRRTRI
jgi:hypothetical protein